MKLAASGSGYHGEDPPPTCHKVSVSSLAMVRFIGSNNILVCEGVWWLFVSFSGAAMVTTEDNGVISCEVFYISLLDTHVCTTTYM
jgi:hypothetical protein